jgi:hypothetical protein
LFDLGSLLVQQRSLELVFFKDVDIFNIANISLDFNHSFLSGLEFSFNSFHRETSIFCMTLSFTKFAIFFTLFFCLWFAEISLWPFWFWVFSVVNFIKLFLTMCPGFSQ